RKNAQRRASAMAAPDRNCTIVALSPLLPVEELPQHVIHRLAVLRRRIVGLRLLSRGRRRGFRWGLGLCRRGRWLLTLSLSRCGDAATAAKALHQRADGPGNIATEVTTGLVVGPAAVVVAVVAIVRRGIPAQRAQQAAE